MDDIPAFKDVCVDIMIKCNVNCPSISIYGELSKYKLDSLKKIHSILEYV